MCAHFCFSAPDGGQQGPHCDREGQDPLGAATAGGQGDFLSTVQWTREDVAVERNTKSLPFYFK